MMGVRLLALGLIAFAVTLTLHSAGSAADTKLVVVFASGWGTTGSPQDWRETWRDIHTAIAQRGHPSVQVRAYSYSADSERSYGSCDTNQPVDASSRLMDRQVRALLSEFPAAQVMVVGHSLGGVVATHWLANYATTVSSGDPLSDRLREATVVTIASPVKGTVLAEGLAGAVVREWVRTGGCEATLLSDLAPGAPAIAALAGAASRRGYYNVASVQDRLIPYSSAVIATRSSNVLKLTSGDGGCMLRYQLGQVLLPAAPLSVTAQAACVSPSHGQPLRDPVASRWIADIAVKRINAARVSPPPSATEQRPAGGVVLLLPYDRTDTGVVFTGGPHPLDQREYCPADTGQASGIDFFRAGGFEVLAPAAATFIGAFDAGDQSFGAGYWILLEHSGGLQTAYWHLDRAVTQRMHREQGLKPGDTIPQGYPIGRSGSSGSQTSNHLHVEVRRGTEPNRPTTGTPLTWDGRQIDGWSIAVHRDSNGAGLSYQGSAVRGTPRVAPITITEAAAGCGQGGRRTTVQARVSAGWRGSDELNRDAAGARIDPNTAFAFTGGQAVHLESTNCRRLSATAGCTGPPPQSSRSTESLTVLVVDVSGSMNDDDRLASAQAAGNALLSVIEAERRTGTGPHFVQLVTFSSSARTIIEATADLATVREGIAGLWAGGRTNIASGLDVAVAAASERSMPQRTVILMTDGDDPSPDSRYEPALAQARSSGVCIYTVGFGKEADTRRLQRISDGAPCGSFEYAGVGSVSVSLTRAFLKARHQSTGVLAVDESTTLRQGETRQVGGMVVAANTSQLLATLSWPGSTARFIVADPSGRIVDATYPGANVSETATDVTLIVTDPVPGTWNLAAEGTDVPEGEMPIAVLASTRAGVPPPPDPPDPVVDRAGGIGTPVIVALAGVGGAAILGVVAVLLFVATQAGRKPAGWLTVDGRQVPIQLRHNAFTLGRGPSCDLVLADPHASAQHARIEQRGPSLFVVDLQSQNGTNVDGRRVAEALLLDGTEIGIGRSRINVSLAEVAGERPPAAERW